MWVIVEEIASSKVTSKGFDTAMQIGMMAFLDQN